MALQPWTAPPGGDPDGGDPASAAGALALVTTASGERVTMAEYERRVKEVREEREGGGECAERFEEGGGGRAGGVLLLGPEERCVCMRTTAHSPCARVAEEAWARTRAR